MGVCFVRLAPKPLIKKDGDFVCVCNRAGRVHLCFFLWYLSDCNRTAFKILHSSELLQRTVYRSLCLLTTHPNVGRFREKENVFLPQDFRWVMGVSHWIHRHINDGIKFVYLKFELELTFEDNYLRVSI